MSKSLLKATDAYNNKRFMQETKTLNPSINTQIVPNSNYTLSCCNISDHYCQQYSFNCGAGLTAPTGYGAPQVEYATAPNSKTQMGALNQQLQAQSDKLFRKARARGIDVIKFPKDIFKHGPIKMRAPSVLSIN